MCITNQSVKNIVISFCNLSPERTCCYNPFEQSAVPGVLSGGGVIIGGHNVGTRPSTPPEGSVALPGSPGLPPPAAQLQSSLFPQSKVVLRLAASDSDL